MLLLTSLTLPQLGFIFFFAIIILIALYSSWQFRKVAKHQAIMADVDPDFNYDPMKIMVHKSVIDEKKTMFVVHEQIEDMYTAEDGSCSDYLDKTGGSYINAFTVKHCRKATEQEVEQYCMLIKAVGNG